MTIQFSLTVFHYRTTLCNVSLTLKNKIASNLKEIGLLSPVDHTACKMNTLCLQITNIANGVVVIIITFRKSSVMFIHIFNVYAGITIGIPTAKLSSLFLVIISTFILRVIIYTSVSATDYNNYCFCYICVVLLILNL